MPVTRYFESPNSTSVNFKNEDNCKTFIWLFFFQKPAHYIHRLSHRLLTSVLCAIHFSLQLLNTTRLAKACYSINSERACLAKIVAQSFISWFAISLLNLLWFDNECHHTESWGSSPIILPIVRGIKPVNDSHLFRVEQQQATDWNYVISWFYCSRISTAATSTYHYVSTLHSPRIVIIAADKIDYPPNHDF